MFRRPLVLALALAFALGLPLPGHAAHLAPPANLTCPVAGGDIFADWDDVPDATKYSVGVIAGYDTNGDSVANLTLDLDFGTSDRTDGAPAGQSDLTIALSALDTWFDTTGDGFADVLLSPVSVDLRVKALHSGRNQGRQNAPFSAPCSALP
jgi:hypothetical protein